MIIYGKNTVKELFNKDKSQILKVWIERKRHQSFAIELENSGFKTLDIKSLSYKKVNLTGQENIQGVIAEIKDPKIYSLNELLSSLNNKRKPKLLILDQIEDPQNFGAIIRNAAAFNVDGIIFPSKSAVGLTPIVLKASAGNWINIKLCETNSLNSVIQILKKNYYWIVSTSLDGNSSMKEIKELNQPIALILGNEGKGVRKSLQDKSDFKIKISMNKKVESLNVASASAIIFHFLYEE